MGCPDAIVDHFTGMQGVDSIKFDIERRLFILFAENFDKNKIIEALYEISVIEKREFILESYSETKNC
jgi:hypothetical protein